MANGRSGGRCSKALAGVDPLALLLCTPPVAFIPTRFARGSGRNPSFRTNLALAGSLEHFQVDRLRSTARKMLYQKTRAFPLMVEML